MTKPKSYMLWLQGPRFLHCDILIYHCIFKTFSSSNQAWKRRYITSLLLNFLKQVIASTYFLNLADLIPGHLLRNNTPLTLIYCLMARAIEWFWIILFNLFCNIDDILFYSHTRTHKKKTRAISINKLKLFTKYLSINCPNHILILNHLVLLNLQFFM